MQRYTAFHLKCIALVAMFINHLGHVFEMVYRNPFWDWFYLAIGHLTFPIMVFFMVEGFHYTSNVYRYALRFAAFWLLSILPFHYAFNYDESINWVNNIMFTLMMGLLMLVLISKSKFIWLDLLIVILFGYLTQWSDWNFFSMPLIYGFYRYRGKPKAYLILLSSAALIMGLINLSFYWEYLAFPLAWSRVLDALGLITVYPLLKTYSGERGYSPSWLKWGFYAFYPLHLYLLVGIRLILIGY